MHVLRLVLGGLIAVAVAMPVGILVVYVVPYIIPEYVRSGRFAGFGDPEGLAYAAAFAIFAFPALLLALAAIRTILVQYALRLLHRLAVGAIGGAAGCWTIFSLYQPIVFPHGLGPIWPLLLAMGAAGGIVVALLTRRVPPMRGPLNVDEATSI